MKAISTQRCLNGPGVAARDQARHRQTLSDQGQRERNLVGRSSARGLCPGYRGGRTARESQVDTLRHQADAKGLR